MGGFSNVTANFMHLMNNVYREHLDKSLLVFLDYILVFHKTKEETEQHLRLGLQGLRVLNLYAKL